MHYSTRCIFGVICFYFSLKVNEHLELRRTPHYQRVCICCVCVCVHAYFQYSYSVEVPIPSNVTFFHHTNTRFLIFPNQYKIHIFDFRERFSVVSSFMWQVSHTLHIIILWDPWEICFSAFLHCRSQLSAPYAPRTLCSDAEYKNRIPLSSVPSDSPFIYFHLYVFNAVRLSKMFTPA